MPDVVREVKTGEDDADIEETAVEEAAE
jgi:hypothetical protein